MAITDLTNTAWYFNSGWSDTTAYTEAISGRVYYNNSWHGLPTGSTVSIYEDEIVFQNPSWDNNIVMDTYDSFALGIYTYTNTNDFFVDFVNNNGTQLKVTDLTDTTWTVNSGWQARAGYGVYDITTSYDASKCSFLVGYSFDADSFRYVSTANNVYFGEFV